jgi:hypothetical protein
VDFFSHSAKDEVKQYIRALAIMNNYEDWAQLVAKKLKGEADVIAAIEKDQLDDAAATEAFVRAVLTPFLPENFGVGEGRIVDAFGNRSDHFDVIIYSRDFPRIGLRGLQSDYLYESVLAAFTIRAKYVRKTFFESMNACASLATLSTNTDKSVLVRLAKKNGLKPGPNKSFVHEDPLHTTRFELIGCPPAFMFGFSGIKNSYRQLQENIELWILQRQSKGLATSMRTFPAVIATQGCFAWRNAAPLALSNREMLGIGNDPAPIRLIVLQMLYLLNRRLHAAADSYGMKPNLNAYLSQFSMPKFELGVGDVDELVSSKLPEGAAKENDRKDFQPARDHAQKAAAAAVAVAVEPKVVAEPEVAATPEVVAEPEVAATPEVVAEPEVAATPEVVAEPEVAATPEVVAEPEVAATPELVAEPEVAATPEVVAEPEVAAAPEVAEEPKASAGVFDQPSPFASAPAPAGVEPQAEKKAQPARYKAPTATLGSAPIPGLESPVEEVKIEPEPGPELEATNKPPVATLGSAPIPPSKPAKPTAVVSPPRPPIDLDLSDFQIPEELTAETDHDSTAVVKPDASVTTKNKAQSSTEAFIARVKEQLSNPANLSENDEDPFISTIPQ